MAIPPEKKKAPCECGSRKQYRRCCLKRPPNMNKRSDSIVFDTGPAGMKLDQVSVNIATGQMKMLHEGSEVTPASASYVRIMKRQHKGPKPLVAIPTKQTDLCTGDQNLLGFDKIFSVDTNHPDIHGNRICIMSIIEVVNIRKMPPDMVSFDYAQVASTEFIFNSEKFENYGWMLAIKALEHRPDISNYQKIALIVDSDFSNLAHFNTRAKPLTGDCAAPRTLDKLLAKK